MPHLCEPQLHIFCEDQFRLVVAHCLKDSVSTVQGIVARINDGVGQTPASAITCNGVAGDVSGHRAGQNIGHLDVVYLVDFAAQGIHIADQTVFGCAVGCSQGRPNPSRHGTDGDNVAAPGVGHSVQL